MTRTLVAGLLCLAAGAPGRAESAELADLLRRPVIDPALPLAEVERFTASRVHPMPEFESADEWQRFAEQMRQEILDRVVFRGQGREWREADCRVEWSETLPGGPGYRIRKLRYEAVPGLWIPALLYEPENPSGRVPAVLNVNGHDRTGKAAAYKQVRCINLARRGMIALNVEWLGMGQLRGDDYAHYRLNQLDLCGTSGVAPFFLSMQRGIDVLLSHEHADPERVAVAGLSGGGWQTIFISSLDPRVSLCNPVAGYSSFATRAYHHSDLGDSEQTPVDLGLVSDYALMTAMLAPRAALLTFNATDNCCFAADHALFPLLAAARPIYQLSGHPQRLRAHVNYVPGNHNFLQDNREALYRMIGDHFHAGDAAYDWHEIPCEDELLAPDELDVELPADNESLHSLAVRLSGSLPKSAPTQIEQRRELLTKIVRSERAEATAEAAEAMQQGDVTARSWRFRIGNDWTVPATELVRGEPTGTAILVADGGRGSAGGRAEQLLADGYRVLAVDPFYFGESKITSRDYLFALLVSAVGKRPLGVQADQVAAIARWVAANYGTDVLVVSEGPRSSLYALVAAALETQAIAAVELHGSMQSLQAILDKNQAVNAAPELFCFGLYEYFDISQLKQLVSPRALRVE